MPHAMMLVLGLLLQDQDADRLKRLEEQVKRQQEEIEALKKGQEKERKNDVGITLADGLRAKSADGQHEVHVGGRFQEHYRQVFDRPDASRTNPDTFFIRAARVQVDGTFFKDFGFMVQGDFPSSTTGPTPTVQAAYLEWKRLTEIRVTAGQFKAPASQDRLVSRLFGDFVEDSPLTRFVPGYDIGLMVHGRLFDGIFGYQAAVVNGRSHLDNQGRSRHDDNDEKEAVVRLTLSPWAPDKESPIRQFRFGVYGSITDTDDVAISGAGVTTFDISTPELGVTFLDPNAGFLDGRRSRIGLELSLAWGPLAFRAEYLLRSDEMVNGALEEDVDSTAWYVAVTWIVTGETKLVESRITPAKPFDLAGGWGAVELVLRFSHAEVDDSIEDIGVSLAVQSNEVSIITFGVNWWLQRNVRVSANVVREDYHDEITFGGGRTEDTLLGILFRFQIDF